MKILFVCTGNTCRSPMAQGLAGFYLTNEYEIFSAGIDAFDGDCVSENAVKALRGKGIDISGHKAVRLRRELITHADYVFTMTRSQEAYLSRTYPEFKEKFMLLGDWTNSCREISDPWLGSYESYQDCAQELEEIIKTMAKSLLGNKKQFEDIEEVKR